MPNKELDEIIEKYGHSIILDGNNFRKNRALIFLNYYNSINRCPIHSSIDSFFRDGFPLYLVYNINILFEKVRDAIKKYRNLEDFEVTFLDDYPMYIDCEIRRVILIKLTIMVNENEVKLGDLLHGDNSLYKDNGPGDKAPYLDDFSLTITITKEEPHNIIVRVSGNPRKYKKRKYIELFYFFKSFKKFSR